MRYMMASAGPVPNGGWPPAAHAPVSPPREDVGRRACLPGDLLGRHESGRAHGQASPGDGGRVRGLRDAEVDDLRPSLGEDHIAGLEVAVDYSGCVVGIRAAQTSLCQRPVVPLPRPPEKRFCSLATPDSYPQVTESQGLRMRTRCIR